MHVGTYSASGAIGAHNYLAVRFLWSTACISAELILPFALRSHSCTGQCPPYRYYGDTRPVRSCLSHLSDDGTDCSWEIMVQLENLLVWLCPQGVQGSPMSAVCPEKFLVSV